MRLEWKQQGNTHELWGDAGLFAMVMVSSGGKVAWHVWPCGQKGNIFADCGVETGPTALADAKRAAEEALRPLAVDPLDEAAAKLGLRWANDKRSLARMDDGSPVAHCQSGGNLVLSREFADDLPGTIPEMLLGVVATLLGKAQPAEDAKPIPPESPDNSPFHLGGDPALLVTPAPSPAPEQDEAERWAKSVVSLERDCRFKIGIDQPSYVIWSSGYSPTAAIAAALRARDAERDAERDARIAREAASQFAGKLLDILSVPCGTTTGVMSETIRQQLAKFIDAESK